MPNQNVLNNRAKLAGKRSAMRGFDLPSDGTLESRFGKDGMEFYKKSYAKYCGTPQEQMIKRVEHAAKQCIYKGKNLPPDEVLIEKFGEYVALYKNTYLKFSKDLTQNSPNPDDELIIDSTAPLSQNTSNPSVQNQNDLNHKAEVAGRNAAKRGYSLPPDKKLTSRFGKEGMEFYKKSYAEHCGTAKEQQLKKLITTAKEYAWKGISIPPDNVLAKRYGIENVELYKKTYLLHLKESNKDLLLTNELTIDLLNTESYSTIPQNISIDNINQSDIPNSIPSPLQETDAIVSDLLRSTNHSDVQEKNTPEALNIIHIEKIPNNKSVLSNKAPIQKSSLLGDKSTIELQNTSRSSTLNQSNLNKKAIQSGRTAAQRGAPLPPDYKLEPRFGKEGMEFYKKSYAENCGTAEEQQIKKMICAAKEYAWKGRKLPPDAILAERYGIQYVELYKKIYSQYLKKSVDKKNKNKPSTNESTIDLNDKESHSTIPKNISIDNINKSNIPGASSSALQEVISVADDLLKPTSHPYIQEKSTSEVLNTEGIPDASVTQQGTETFSDETNQFNMINSLTNTQEYIFFPDHNPFNDLDELFLNLHNPVELNEKNTLEEVFVNHSVPPNTGLVDWLFDNFDQDPFSLGSQEGILTPKHNPNTLLFSYNQNNKSDTAKEDSISNPCDVNNPNDSLSLDSQKLICSPFEIFKKK